MRATAWRMVLALGLGAVSALSGCAQTGDIGRQCLLVKSDGNGGTAPILAGEVEAGRDIISFGALECDDFICVRHRFEPLPEDPAAQITGTCSTPCVQGAPGACEGIFPDADLNDGAFTCRALLLDEASISVFCEQEPELCEQYFGQNRTPTYCAQGAEEPAQG